MPPAEHTDGRRRRGAISRSAIVDAATALFSTRGYAGTTISAIAAAADVHAGSLYHAFGSKQGLLSAVMATVADRAFAAVKAVTDLPRATVADRLRDTAHALIDDPVFLRLFLLLALENVDDPEVRALVDGVRRRARAAVADALLTELSGLDAATRTAVTDVAGRIALILLDGIFVSHQLDSEHAELDTTLHLVTAIAEKALHDAPALFTGHSPPPRTP
ncbi:TetR/AcrR family transcriptional regulator [Actinokineospora bangkokensis]|uniref:HTH tetR-type domain-containing protein n=1 Tax=Actinokineospora bangkokensis TaxID=1193682 RepID=A0A1Q9LIJ2_9PSEU|nr:TetR/AcrR family transcriptional regulator [Actinokineospora bangkokensis]OLR91872.1 hypothetical protein BJP25_23855 [Actinokineospora bangkokensis]